MTQPRPTDELDPRRLSAEGVERYLRRHGLEARKNRSQNHLVDGQIIEDIVALADIATGSHVLEIGPGLGVLTGALLVAGANVTTVEVDSRLAAHLRTRYEERIASGGLRLVEADVLDTPLDDIAAAPYDVVANLPYHITSPVLHYLLGDEPRPERFVLMVQREVAERISADPGDMSYLSVFVQYHAAVRIAFLVPREAFEPSPDVESAVVEIRPADPMGDRPRLSAADEDELWRLVQAGFRERRKKLHNVISRQLTLSSATVQEALDAAGIDGNRRPQTLDVEEWLALRIALTPLPVKTAR